MIWTKDVTILIVINLQYLWQFENNESESDLAKCITWSSQGPLSYSPPSRAQRAKDVFPPQHLHHQQAAQTEVHHLLQAPQTPPRARCPPGFPPPCSPPHPCCWCEAQLWGPTIFWKAPSSSRLCRAQTAYIYDTRPTGSWALLRIKRKLCSESEFVASWQRQSRLSRTPHTTGSLSHPTLLLTLSCDKTERKFWIMEQLFTLGSRICKDLPRNSVKYSFLKTSLNLCLLPQQKPF